MNIKFLKIHEYQKQEHDLNIIKLHKKENLKKPTIIKSHGLGIERIDSGILIN